MHINRNVGGALLPLAAAFLGIMGTANAAPRFVMEIRDAEGNLAVEGSSDAPGHAGAIEVLGFGKEFSTPKGFQPLDTTTLDCGIRPDSTLPVFAAAATSLDTTFAQVDIFYLGDDSEPLTGATSQMTLSHVQVTAFSMGIGSANPLGPAFASSEVPVAHLSLNFSKVEWKYTPVRDTRDGETSFAYSAFEPTEDPGFDDDADGLSNAEDDDDDNDQVPDSYEAANGMDAFAHDADGDADEDKQSNRTEWLAGTRSDDGTSFFAISSLAIEQTPDGKVATVSFPIIGGRHYRLVGTPDPQLPRESWIEFDAFDTAPESPDSTAEVVLNPGVLPQLGRILFAVEVRETSP